MVDEEKRKKKLRTASPQLIPAQCSQSLDPKRQETIIFEVESVRGRTYYIVVLCVMTLAVGTFRVSNLIGYLLKLILLDS